MWLGRRSYVDQQLPGAPLSNEAPGLRSKEEGEGWDNKRNRTWKVPVPMPLFFFFADASGSWLIVQPPSIFRPSGQYHSCIVCREKGGNIRERNRTSKLVPVRVLLN
jgi:hypothetical protein